MAKDPNSEGEFEELYRSTLAPLRRYLGRLLGNSAEAQDVAHDAYLRVYPKEGKTPAAQPKALLFTAARRLAINRLKRRSISPIVNGPADFAEAASQSPGVAREVMARQEAEMLHKALDGLPAGCRSVLLLRKLDHLSHREIGRRLGIAVSTVEKQHARALRLLKTAMEDMK